MYNILGYTPLESYYCFLPQRSMFLINKDSFFTEKSEREEFISKVYALNEEFYYKKGRYPAAYTHHYGCQQNVSDGEKINGMLSAMGYFFTDNPEEADLVLFNTCAVRGHAEDRIYGNVGALKKSKRDNPDKIVALCGCMVQQEHVVNKIKNSFNHVDIAFGPAMMPDFPKILYSFLKGRKKLLLNSDRNLNIREHIPVKRDSTFKAFVPIMYGCNNFCTYCVVPYVRGREVSRESMSILEEIRLLAGSGYKEIMLLGQNVNSYNDGSLGFPGLLEEIQKIDGDFKIRFMTSHPKDCSRELLDVMAVSDKIYKHLQLPVQSGSNRILGEMNRHYTREKYLEIIAYAKKVMPGITFTSDIIVGFPGETYGDFKETLELVKEVRYLSLFTFIYSKREGTKAAEMADNVSTEEKKKWFNELLEVQNNIGRELYQSRIGRRDRVLVEEANEDGTVTGKNGSAMTTVLKGTKEDIGKFKDVLIKDAKAMTLYAEGV